MPPLLSPTANAIAKWADAWASLPGLAAATDTAMVVRRGAKKELARASQAGAPREGHLRPSPAAPAGRMLDVGSRHGRFWDSPPFHVVSPAPRPGAPLQTGRGAAGSPWGRRRCRYHFRPWGDGGSGAAPWRRRGAWGSDGANPAGRDVHLLREAFELHPCCVAAAGRGGGGGVDGSGSSGDSTVDGRGGGGGVGEGMPASCQHQTSASNRSQEGEKEKSIGREAETRKSCTEEEIAST